MPNRNPDDDIPEIAPIDEIRPGKIPCPVCGKTMQIEAKGRVAVDVCPDHGIWLDKGELEQIFRSIRLSAAGSHRLALKVARAKERPKCAHHMWWSLFLD